MAIVQNPITGRTRKAFGTAVFSKHYERNTMRSKPIQVSNPRTEGQVMQRSKFAQTVDLIRQVLPVVNGAYSNTLKNMSPFNKIVSINDAPVSIILVNCAKNKALNFANAALRSESAASITAPVEWVGDVVAAYFSTTDLTTSVPKASGSIPAKKVIRFKAGADLVKTVKYY